MANKEYLCKCNNCDAILYDENPQIDAQKIDIANFEMIIPMELLNDEGDSYWGCPNCQTDAYLTEIYEN